MKCIIKIAGTGIILDTNMDEERANGTLLGVPYKLSAGGELDIYRTNIKADDNTGWDYAYRAILKQKSTSTNVLRVGVPTNDGIQEFHYNPGVHAVLGPTGSGKNFTLFRGIKPFVDLNPVRMSSIYTYGEDKIEGGIKLNDPEDLFVELASDILDQISSFYALKDEDPSSYSGTLKNGNGYATKLIDILNDTYNDEDELLEELVQMTPLPRVLYLDSIRDFVYSKGIQGAGGFNMRITMEISFLKALVEELNFHMFVTVNPLVSFKDTEAMNKIESDAESSTSTVLSIRPTAERQTTPHINLFARGASNPDRSVSKLRMRNLIESPVTAEELKNFAAGVIADVDNHTEYEGLDTVSYAQESMVNAPVKANKTYGTSVINRNKQPTQDTLLSALNNINSVNEED